MPITRLPDAALAVEPVATVREPLGPLPVPSAVLTVTEPTTHTPPTTRNTPHHIKPQTRTQASFPVEARAQHLKTQDKGHMGQRQRTSNPCHGVRVGTMVGWWVHTHREGVHSSHRLFD